MIDTKKLRQKILDLAIRGKLVPQDPNDEPASVLLERIRAEKERLIAEGKIKRPKKAKTSSSESHYQQLPDNWVKITIGELARTITDFVASGSFSSLRENVKYYDTPNYAILVRTKDFQNNFQNGLVYTDKHGYNFLANSNLHGGELILPNIGASIGKVFIAPNLNRPMTLAPNSIMIKCWDEITIRWLYYFFLSSVGQIALQKISSSTAQGKFNKTDFKEIVIPLPSIKEQERIIKQIQILDSILVSIEKDTITLLNRIETTKSKILELAMQGKLVPQDSTAEPAIDMLRRINPKAKIITDNPHSWNIPIGWILGSLKEIVNCPSSKQFQIQQSEIKQNGRIPVISQSSNFIEGYSENDDKIFHPNNGIVIFGDHTKNVKFFSEDFIIGADGVKLIDWDFNKRFLFYLIKYISGKIPDKGYSRHFQYLLTYVVGLPPLNEQKRIVSKIEELYAYLDEMEASLQS